jgi:hypothetical protein
MNRSRLAYAIAALFVIALGLLWRRPELGLSPFVAKYGGSALWGAMVFFVCAALVPTAARERIALAAAVISAGVEFSQLLHVGWLDDVRRTVVGQLLLGRTFAWGDIASYWIGILSAFCVVAVIFRQFASAAAPRD